MNKKTVRDMDLKGKKVIMRVDFNVPLNEEGKITDDARIVAALPTIKYILSHGAGKLILMSHLGRPKGKVVESMRMAPVGRSLAALLGEQVLTLQESVGSEVKKAVDNASERVILLENLRFHPEEEKGDDEFAKKLASLADVYVNDAFGTAHRAHASTTIIAKYLPAVVGFLMEKEIEYLGKIATNPEKPFVAILGGAKVSDKIVIIEKLLDKVDKLLIGGAMAYTFKRALGQRTGNSLVEEDKIDLAKKIMAEAQAKGVKLVLPIDTVAVLDFNKPDTMKIFKEIDIPYDGVDIGPESIELFKKELRGVKTVLWNGPVGVFEKDAYAQGTKELALFLADSGATVVVGGGDSASAARKFKVKDKLAHVSTGGGASLELLEGKELPGVAIIPEK
jgi:phosphoglycerate kinase